MYYFAYGSNLNVEQMKARCPSAIIMGTAYLQDHRLAFRGSKTGAYLTVIPSKGDSVPIGVWDIDEADLRSLDRYEGYPTFYDRKEIELQCYLNDWTPSFTARGVIYIMTGNRQPGIPSERYLEVCRHGYKDFEFSVGPITEAYEEAEREVGCLAV